MNKNIQSSLRFVLFATGVTAIGGFLFGYDTAVINGAISYLKLHMNLNAAQEGMAGASAIAGCVPGAMFAGFLSDRFGRRKMLFLCALLYAVSGLHRRNFAGKMARPARHPVSPRNRHRPFSPAVRQQSRSRHGRSSLERR